MKGWVYILTNKAIPDLIKLGHTTREPEARVKELSSSTGLPHPYIVEYKALVDESHKTEQKAHQILKSYRENKYREFFRCDIATGIDAIKEAANGTINEEFIRSEEERKKAIRREAEKAEIERKKKEELANAKAKEENLKFLIEQKRKLDEQKQRLEKEKSDVLLREKTDKETKETINESFLGLWAFLAATIILIITNGSGFIFSIMIVVINIWLRLTRKKDAKELRNKLKLQCIETQINQSLIKKDFLAVISLVILIIISAIGLFNTSSNDANNNSNINSYVPPNNTAYMKQQKNLANTPSINNNSSSATSYAPPTNTSYITQQNNADNTSSINRSNKTEEIYIKSNSTESLQTQKSDLTDIYANKPISKHKNKSIKRKKVEKIENTFSQEIVKNNNQIVEPGQIWVQPQEQKPVNTERTLSLQEKAEADSRAFSLRQQKLDKKQREETSAWIESQARAREEAHKLAE